MSSHLTRRSFLQRSAAAAGALALGSPLEARSKPGVVLVWSEGSAPRRIYPNDINHAIAEGLAPLHGWTVRTAGLNDPDQGLSDAALDEADVIIWWGHIHHADVHDDRADSVVRRVQAGTLGFIGTHSAHWSKPFTRLMGTSCSWENGYIEDGSRVDVSVADRRHPIARGIRDFVIPHTERYGEPFVVPPPQDLVFDGIYTLPNGQKQPSRQGMTWTVGAGRIFYFQPGHESYPIYYQEEVRHVFRNAVPWVRPQGSRLRA